MKNNQPQYQKNIFDEYAEGIANLIENAISKGGPALMKVTSPLLNKTLNLRRLRKKYSFLEKLISSIEIYFRINKLNIIEYRDILDTRRPPLPNAIGFNPKDSYHLLNSDFENYCNTLIVGGTGSGKTVFLNTLIHRCIKDNIPNVIVDPKGDMDELQNFVIMNKFHNREFLIFTVIKGFKNKTIGYNPVKDGTFSEIADRIMNAFIWSESYYQHQAKIALIDVVESIQKAKEVVTLERIYDRLVTGEYDQKAISGLKSQLLAICKSDFGPLLNSETALSLTDLRLQGKNIYIGLCSGSHPTIAPAIGKLMIGDLRSHSAEVVGLASEERNKIFPKPYEIFFDEFAHFVCEDMIEVCNKDRASKISVTLCVQSLSDISKGEHDYLNRLIENVKNRAIFQQEGPSNVDIAMKLGGTTEFQKQSSQISEGSETGLGSARDAHKLLLRGEVLRNLNQGQCIFKIVRPRPMQILLNVLKTDIEKMNAEIKTRLKFNISDYCKTPNITLLNADSLKPHNETKESIPQEKPFFPSEIRDHIKKRPQLKNNDSQTELPF